MKAPNNSQHIPQETKSELPTASSMLLQNVRALEPEGWSRLVSTFGPVVYNWCRSSGVPDSDAPDLVQEVFIAVARGIAKFERQKEQGSFRAWLATITRNKVRDFYRRESKHQDAVGGSTAAMILQQVPDSLEETISEDSAQPTIFRQLFLQVEAEFEPGTWQAFWLTTVEQLSAKEVAERLGVSIASVYQSKSRVLRRMRSTIAEHPFSE